MFWKRLFCAVFLLVLCFALSATSAFGQDGPTPGEAEALAPAPGTGPGFVMISAPAFVPVNSTMLYQLGSGTFLKTLPDSPDYQYIAPVMLPQGARINRVVAYYQDTDPARVIEFILYRFDPTSSNFWILAEFESANGNTYSYISADSVVDNKTYVYILKLNLRPVSDTIYFMIFRAVRIDYDFTADLPLVQK